MSPKQLFNAVFAVASEAPPTPVYRRWSHWTLGLVSFFLLLVGGVIVVIDPLMQYRKPWLGLRTVMWKEDYLNPGLARKWPHDATVIGGSYVQNSKVSELDRLFGLHAIKLTNRSSSVPRIHALMKLALECGQPQKALFISLPMNRLVRGISNEDPVDGPSYLYDTSTMNDMGYWLNADVSGFLLDLALRRPEQPKSDSQWLDDAYGWYAQYKDRFGKAFVLQRYRPAAPKAPLPRESFLVLTDRTLDEYLLPLIEAHPETTFYFFQPPHSRLFWRDNCIKGNLGAWLAAYRRFCERLLMYPNVRVFNFMNFGAYSDDLNNYMDWSHYKPDANSMMFADMANDRHRVWSIPTQEELDALLAWAREYQDPDIPVYRKIPKPSGTRR